MALDGDSEAKKVAKQAGFLAREARKVGDDLQYRLVLLETVGNDVPPEETRGHMEMLSALAGRLRELLGKLEDLGEGVDEELKGVLRRAEAVLADSSPNLSPGKGESGLGFDGGIRAKTKEDSELGKVIHVIWPLVIAKVAREHPGLMPFLVFGVPSRWDKIRRELLVEPSMIMQGCGEAWERVRAISENTAIPVVVGKAVAEAWEKVFGGAEAASSPFEGWTVRLALFPSGRG
jgi:hypothetical protein